MPERHLCRPITSTADVLRYIPYSSEKQIALHFLRRLPNIRLTYEPEQFQAVDTDGKLRATVPDFKIEYLDTGKKVYVEITAAELTDSDPKARQKRIMQKAAPDARYVVLYKDSLQRIQAKYPDVHIFHSVHTQRRRHRRRRAA